MKQFKVVPLSITLFFFFVNTSIFSQVIVSITPPPPNQFKIESLWNITLTNMTMNNYEVYLNGRVIESYLGLMFDAVTTRFSLKPGITKLNLPMISPIKVNYSNTKYQEVIVKTGSVPEGAYDYCISVIDVSNNSEIGQGCLPTLQVVRNPLQIILVSPFNGQIVEEDRPIFMVILQHDDEGILDPRLPPFPYENKKTRIVEIIGNQTPLDAINSNPTWFEFNTKQNFFHYPLNARRFEYGKQYAWQVTIYDKNNIKVCESEIGTFTFKPSAIKSNLIETKFNIKQESDDYFLCSSKHITVNPFNSIQISRLNFEKNNLYFPDDTLESPSPIRLSGSTKLYTQTSDRQGNFSEIPRNLWRWDLNATLSVYEIPIGFSTFISSEQKDIRQNINMFRFQFSPQQLIISGADKLKESFLSKFLNIFSNIGIGTCYPNYSPMTISGVPVSGVDIEFTPGIFYLAFTYGRTQKAIQGDTIIQPTYERKLIGGKIGLGKKQGAHFHITFMHSADNEASIFPDTFLTSPQENYLLGLETEISLFEKLFNLKGELVGSFITRDTRSSELNTDKIPNWIRNTLKPKISSSIDYAYFISSSFNLPTSTILSGYYKMIGPGFVSHGVPYLRNDLESYEIKAEQRLLQNSISFGGYYRNDHDNLIPWKRTTTTVSSYGVNFGLRFRDFPFIQLSYSPYFQKNNLDSGKMDNTTRLFSCITSYNSKIVNLLTSTNLFFSYQDSKTVRAMSNFTSRNYSLNETVTFEFPLSISTTLSLLNANYPNITSDVFSFDLVGSYTFFESWQNSIGFNFSNDKDIDKKFGFYLSSSMPIWNFASLEISAEKNFYKDLFLIENNYDELILRATLSKSW